MSQCEPLTEFALMLTWTMCHWPPRHVTGMEKKSPSGTP